MLGAVAVVVGAGLLTAPAATAELRTLTFGPVADTTVQADKPTKANGSKEKLTVERFPPTYSYLTFTVSGVGSAKVRSATLRLYAKKDSSAEIFLSRVVDTSWSESETTWNTRPETDGTTLAVLGAVRSKSWLDVDISSLVTQDGTYSLRMSSPATDKVDFMSREAAEHQRPQLVVDVEPERSISFGAAGDFGAGDRTRASLAALDQTGVDLFLALGDLSYGETASENAWCDLVTTGLPTLGPDFPFQLLTGNHEEDGASDGHILNFAQCLPDRLGSTVGPQSHYGTNYYFDYPASDPLVRVFMISPDHTVGGVDYRYRAGDELYSWLSNAIDAGRDADIPWTVVGMHKPCISSSTDGCQVGQPLWNMLLDKHVDLVLAGHNHNYQRSKQLALKQDTCSSFVIGGFTQACVADNGTGVMAKGSGTVFSIVGNFGRTGSAIDETDPEAGYFAATDGVTNGFMTITVTEERLEGTYTSTTGSFHDSFAISPEGGWRSDRVSPTPPAGLVAMPNGGDRIDLTWTPSTDNVTVAHYTVTRDGEQVATTGGTSFSDGGRQPATQYAYVVQAVDSAGNVSEVSDTVTATTSPGRVLRLEVTDDATIRASAPTSNFGKNSGEIAIDAAPDEDGMLKFTVAGIGSDTVTNAKLRLFNLDSSDSGGDFFRTEDNGWTETDVTWSSAPEAVGQAVHSLGAVATNSWYEVDLTELIRERGDGAYSLRVSTSSTNTVKWASRQDSAGRVPVLAVTVSSP